MAEQAKVPVIRFAGFTDPWEQRKLGDVADLLTGYPFESRHFTDTGIPLVRGMNVKRGYLDMSADICENWSDAAGVEDYLLKAGDIVIQMDGALIGSSYAMVTPENTPSLLVQRVTRVRCGNRSRYIFQAVQRGFLRYIKSLKTETAVPHLSLSDIADYAIPVPKEEREQEHIGSFFSRLDDLITLHQRKYDKLVVFKKSMLEKMFPKDGESVPEIRFAGFTDPWEQRKLGDVADIKTGPFGTLLHAEDYVDDGIPIVTTEHFKTGVLPKDKEGIPQVSEEDAKRLEQYRAKEGDILFSRVGSVDANAQVFAGQDGWLFSGRVLRARPDLTLVSSAYLHYELETEEVKSSVISRAVGGTMASINTEILFQTPIFIPAKMTEQNKIGSTCARLDSLITLHQRKLELLQNIKKSLLDKMFA